MTGARSFVVTGASGGVGGAIAEHLSLIRHVVNLDPTPSGGKNPACITSTVTRAILAPPWPRPRSRSSTHR